MTSTTTTDKPKPPPQKPKPDKRRRDSWEEWEHYNMPPGFDGR